MNNPYEKALEGLVIKDPVKSFFDWCIERENIRIKREKGISAPWTDDTVFQKGRFLNTFREDDRGSKAVQKFCAPFKDSLSELVHALFFARWCNKDTTLDLLDPSILKQTKNLKVFLLNSVPQPWFSVVYPVVSIYWEGKVYDRFEVCTDLLPELIDFLVKCIKASDGNVVTATEMINSKFGMSNDFPIFMAVIDISWFDPETIKPDTPVPSGIGAIPYLNRLQDHLGLEDHHATASKMIELQAQYWPSSPRKFTPVDIEYLSCECRKYYSYVNGTKKFEGKNVFTPKEILN